MCLSTNSSPDQERSMFNLSSRAKIERWRICDEESRNRSLRAAQREGTNRSCTVRRNASRYFASPGVEGGRGGGRWNSSERRPKKKKRRRRKGTKGNEAGSDRVHKLPTRWNRFFSPRFIPSRDGEKNPSPIGSPIFEFESNFLVLARSNEALKTRGSDGE